MNFHIILIPKIINAIGNVVFIDQEKNKFFLKALHIMKLKKKVKELK